MTSFWKSLHASRFPMTLTNMTFRNEIDSISIDIGTVRQWREAGLGTAAFRSLVRAGEHQRPRQGVYVRAPSLAAAESAPATRHALRAAAAIASQTTRKAAASHQSAALMHSLD